MLHFRIALYEICKRSAVFRFPPNSLPVQYFSIETYIEMTLAHFTCSAIWGLPLLTGAKR